MVQPVSTPDVDIETLRCEIRKEYAEVASNPEKGFHFHTGQPLAEMLGYADAWVDALPAGAVESFAGTGNRFSLVEERLRLTAGCRLRGVCPFGSPSASLRIKLRASSERSLS